MGVWFNVRPMGCLKWFVIVIAILFVVAIAGGG